MSYKIGAYIDFVGIPVVFQLVDVDPLVNGGIQADTELLQWCYSVQYYGHGWETGAFIIEYGSYKNS